MRRPFLWVILAVVAMYAGGIRFHGESITGYFEKWVKKDYRNFYFREGIFITGELLEDKGDKLAIRIGKGTVYLSKEKIVKIEKVKPGELKAKTQFYGLAIGGQTPLLTQRYEESIMPWLKKRFVKVKARVGTKPKDSFFAEVMKSM